MSPAYLTLVVFVLTYLGFFTLTNYRGWIATAGMIAVLALGLVAPGEAAAHIPWTVLMIFVGVLIISEALMISRIPNVAAEWIVAVSPNSGMALLLLCLASSMLSIFIENIACVLIMAPLGIAIARRVKMSPIAPIIGIAIASNLQGCGTLIGDPPSMLLAAEMKLGFNQFFWLNGRPSIFFAVQVGAVASLFVLYYFFRGHDEQGGETEVEEVVSWWPLWFLVLLIVGLFCLSLLTGELTVASGVLCLAVAAISGAWIFKVDREDFWPMLKRLDHQTFFFLLGSFVIVYSLESHGWLDGFAQLILDSAGTNPFVLYSLLVVISVLLSAFIANEPYLIAMLPVTGKLAAATGLPPELHALFYFGLLLGASLGGNITPIGASACVVAYGILRKEGEPVKFVDFVKIGLPFTIAAVGAGCAFLWFFWAP